MRDKVSAGHPLVEEMPVVDCMMEGTALILSLFVAVAPVGPALPYHSNICLCLAYPLAISKVQRVVWRPVYHYDRVQGTGVRSVPGILQGSLLAATVVADVLGQKSVVGTR